MRQVFIILAVFAFYCGHAQEQYFNYKSNWEVVHEFELKDLPKSALEEVNTIYLSAKKDQNSPQIIKSLIFKSKFALTLEEEAKLKIIKELKNEIAISQFPTKNILESVLGEIYWKYFEINRWRIYNRTTTETKIDSSDFRTWDLQTLFKEIGKHYDNSIQDSDKLQQLDLTLYNDILILNDSKEMRPTVYDFLIQRALSFFKNDETNLPKPSENFIIDNNVYLGLNNQFLNFKIESKDSISQHLKALKLFQELTKFHLNDSNPTALIDMTLERLRFVNNNAILKNNDSLYLARLKQLSSIYINHSSSTLIDYQLAVKTNKKCEQYFDSKKELNRFCHAEALEICLNAIKRFPKSSGAKRCEELAYQIQHKALNITSEKYVPINKNSRFLIDYKNLDTLFFSAYKLTHLEFEKIKNIYNDSTRISFVKSRIPDIKWNIKLRNDKDYREHSTEILIPKLDGGIYAIFASENAIISTSKMLYAYNFLQVTDLTLIESDDRKVTIFQVVDRNNGRPIKGAKVNLKSNFDDEWFKKIDRNFRTDNNGQYKFNRKKSHKQVEALVTHKNDSAYFGNYYFYKSSKKNNYGDDEWDEIKPFVFTDRSIYRPGQTIYFKVIVLKKLGGKTELFTDEYIEVLLEDPNGNEVGLLDLKLNKFGSVSGEFKIPNGGLTGEYTIYIDESYEYDSKYYDNADYDFDYDSDFVFSVEEYKRPKFKTEFKPIIKSYKLNDSINVQGEAIAFSGSNISNAKVEYRVVRTANFPKWYSSKNPNNYYSPSQEIIHGETTTDAMGNYDITFIAAPDLKVPKENQPTFNYKINADVTDINGETRSSETIVKVGYHTLVANLTMNPKINKKKNDNQITINTTNLNNEVVGSTGTLKIYKLKSPDNPMRVRPWKAPDYQEISETKFRNLFPNDPYTNDEIDESMWDKGDLMLENKFDTSEFKDVLIGDIDHWHIGKYIVEISCMDSFGQIIKNNQLFTVYDSLENDIPDNSLFILDLDKNSYKPLDTVALKIGSASKDITITLHVKKQNKVYSTHIVHLNNEFKTIQIPISKDDVGGFKVNYHFVNYNGFNSGAKDIFVPLETMTNLQIETLSFRDKVQPGSQQKWSFKIKGTYNNQISAELLASMYDASLDEFKEHQWAFNPKANEQQSYYNSGISNSNSFGINNYFIRNLKKQYYFNYRELQYDKLNWFGFDLQNRGYIKKNYLHRLEANNKIVTDNSRSNFDKTISGVIQDDYGPLPGVNVVIKGTTYGTTTDFDGRYTLKTQNSDVLVFSFLGFITQEIEIGTSKEISLVLEESAQALDEVVVVGYGTLKRRDITGAISTVLGSDFQTGNIATLLNGRIAGVQVNQASGSAGASSSVVLRGASSINGSNYPLYIVDGVPVEFFDISGNDLLDVSILKGSNATALYGIKAANGVVIISTKSGQEKIDEELSKVQARKNLQETAFFYPQLRTNKTGEVHFEFTMPEALTRWKMQLLAHTQNLKTGLKTYSTITQKELMVVPNAPRFLRETDTIVFSSKISNLTTKKLNGFAQILLTDAISGNDITDLLLSNRLNNKNFSLDAQGNTTLKWTLTIPKHKVQSIQYKIVAKSGNFSDGEQNVLPVLSNRKLVTETLPMWINGNETKTFTLEKLKQNKSSTLINHKLTLEVTSNPIWYAIQAMPYLMEYPYECAEQTFARFYANTLATHILNSNPKIKEVFSQWSSYDDLVSNLEKNQELKSLVIQETPWLRDAQSETKQKQRIALLFNLNKMKDESDGAIRKLNQMQFRKGGFPWFSGSDNSNRYISQHIAAGFGHLMKLGIPLNDDSKKITDKLIKHLDQSIIEDYNELIEQTKHFNENSDNTEVFESYMEKKHLNQLQLHYLYLRSLYDEIEISETLETVLEYYKAQSKTYWKEFNLYSKAMIALVQNRSGNTIFANNILNSIKENSIQSDEFGMYWKENTAGYYWHQSPIETQALLIETFSEIDNDIKVINALKTWLLKNKQTNQWKSTKATTEAIYALLIHNTNWNDSESFVSIKIGATDIDPLQLNKSKLEANTGYYKTSFNREEITQDMAEVSLSKNNEGIAWGALYWQYFEDLDKTTSGKSPLKLSKKLFLKKNSSTGITLSEINANTKLKLGDLVTVRIELESDREMEFIHMKDMRASGFEPINVLSEYKFQDGLGYYESTKDASINFFFDKLPKGVYVFEYDLRVNNSGHFSNGITTIQSMYAPEFSNNSEGLRVKIEEQ